MKVKLLVLCFLVSLGGISAQSSDESKQARFHKYMLYKVNEVRTKGCKCGRKRMKKTHKLSWNETLSYSAYLHAKEMDEYQFFAHRSIDGLDIGERADKIGYKWQHIGENLAEGQKTFDEALEDWIESPSHCKMLMNPEMKEMGLAKVGKYWVHHFGTKMPPKTKRGRTFYKEG